MKRLGTRLAMLAGVIGLAVLAIAQAQKDFSSNSNDLEFVNLKQQLADPRPIAAQPIASLTDLPAPPDTQIVRGAEGDVNPIETQFPPIQTPGVQLASHQQPIGGGAISAPSNFDIPSFAPPKTPQPEVAGPSVTSPSDFALPSMPAPNVGNSLSPATSQPSNYALGPPASGQPASAPAMTLPAITTPAPQQTSTPQIITPNPLPPAAIGGPTPNLAPSNFAAAPPASTTTLRDTSDRMTTAGQAVGAGNVRPNGVVDMPGGYQHNPSYGTAQDTTSLTAPGFEFNNEPKRAPQVITPQVPVAAPQPVVPKTAAIAPAPTPTAVPAPRQMPPASRRPVDANNVLNQPGSRLLEGAQAPSLTIHKRAPEEVNVGKQATFAIQVRNTGSTEALNVVVLDAIPRGMELIEAVPQPQVQGKYLEWNLGDLEPGGERTLTLQLMPHEEGELGSVARVLFEAAASVRTVSTRPELKIVQRAPEKVLIGQQVEVEIEVSNPGTGTAYGVVLQEDVPDGLEHPKGRSLDNLLGDIAPGQVRRQRLTMTAVREGVTNNFIQLLSEDEVVAKNSLPIEVVAPNIAIKLDGPTRRFLERRAKYNLVISNDGTAMATNVDIVAYLDRGLSFVSTDHKGQYDATRHAVFWSLAELPVNEVGQVELVLLPIEPGEQMVKLESQADLGISAAAEKPISVETLAEITFSVNDDQDPIEMGTETTYEIKVVNSGSREDTNVQMRLQLPAGVEFVRADQRTQSDGRGMVSFGALPRMGSQDSHTFKVTVRGRQVGTHVLKAILTSDQSKVPVTKEESTMVYADQ